MPSWVVESLTIHTWVVVYCYECIWMKIKLGNLTKTQMYEET